MEGLIPFVCRAIASYAAAGRAQAPAMADWFGDESPSTSYMRLPAGDSGRFRSGAEVHLFSSPPPAAAPGSAPAQPLARRSTPRRPG